MDIPDSILQLAILKTTANGREAPNAYRILSWLYGCGSAEGCITTSLYNHSDEFERVCTYLKANFGIQTIPTRETGASYEFIPAGERTRKGRIPSPRLNLHAKKVYQQFVKGAFNHDPTAKS